MTAGLRALPFVLMAVLSAGSTYAFAQPLTCYPVRAGETAAGLALRFTGDARSRHQPWFQILNPARAAFVPKSRYDIIHAGWRVCVATEVLGQAAQPRSAPPVLVQTGVTQGWTPLDVRILWWVMPLFVIVSGTVLGWFAAGKYVVDRRARIDVMRAFGARFICEFERPLFRRRAAECATRSRLRFAPSRQRLEVLLAPADGRTYPNLLDHRKNVEYDVARVLRVLSDASVIAGSLRAEGPWVVISFRFEINTEQEGAT